MTKKHHIQFLSCVMMTGIMIGCGDKTNNSRSSGGTHDEELSSDESPLNEKRRSSAEDQIIASKDKAHKTAAQSQHGFGFNLTANEIPASLDGSKLPPDTATEAEIVRVKSQPAPSTLYTGKSLNLEKCLESGFGGNSSQASLARQAFPNGAMHLSEILTQDYLLELYGPGEKWFESGLLSLEEWEPNAVMRPKDPVHPFLRKRLGKAVNPGPEFWKLTAVSFRVGDRAMLDPNRRNIPIVGQIKISYALDGRTAGTDPSIISAAFIHSIAIFPEYYDEFIYDLLTIRQDVTVSGCDVFRIIDKYVRNNGSTLKQGSRSHYFFAHANIFDDFDLDPIHEWRFTELKPVFYDLPEEIRAPDDPSKVVMKASERDEQMEMAMMSPSPSPTTSNRYGRINIPANRQREANEGYLRGCKKGNWIPKYAASEFERAKLSAAELKAAQECPAKSTPEEVASCLSAAATSRCEQNIAKLPAVASVTAMALHNRPALIPEMSNVERYKSLGRRLRLVPFRIEPLQVLDDVSDRVKPRPDLAHSVFFSGTVSDCAQLGTSDPMMVGEADLKNPDVKPNINCRLLVKANGTRARADHPAFQREEAYSCAGCHMRREGLQLLPNTNKLTPIASMNKTHIALGDGGNRSCNPFLDFPRSENQASISSYFLEFSNGHRMNGYSPTAANPIPNASLGVFGAGDEMMGAFSFGSTIDSFRCFSRTINPGEKVR